MANRKIKASESQKFTFCHKKYKNKYLGGYWESQQNTDDSFQIQSNWDTQPDSDFEPAQELLDENIFGE
jgi:hypothetical protein